MNLTVSALAHLTGVPVNTLRTWERRYGLGAVSRTEGGQRLYGPEAVERVRLVARAIAAGHRASVVIAAPIAELRALLEAEEELPLGVALGAASGGAGVASVAADPATPAAPVTQAVPPGASLGVAPGEGRRVEAPPAEGPPHPWLASVAALDVGELTRLWRSGVSRHGVEGFLVAEVVPFLRALGDGWRDGTVQVFEEHFVAEALVEFLSTTWRALAELNRGPVAVCATLPGEEHLLGLHMVACGAAAAGWRVVFLGRDTPLPDLLSAAERSHARAVLLSFAGLTTSTQVVWGLEALRQRLPGAVGLAVGGAGAPHVLPAGIDAPGLAGLRAWLAKFEEG